MLRKLCEYKGAEIIEAEACKDHIHMLVSIPPKYSASQIMGYLKGKSSLMIFEKYANLKYKYRQLFIVFDHAVILKIIGLIVPRSFREGQADDKDQHHISRRYHKDQL